jgi:hypothetical protein
MGLEMELRSMKEGKESKILKEREMINELQADNLCILFLSSLL